MFFSEIAGDSQAIPMAGWLQTEKWQNHNI